MSMSIELPPEIEQRLASLAELTGRSKDDLLRAQRKSEPVIE